MTGDSFSRPHAPFWGTPTSVAYSDDSQGGPEANCHACFRYAAAGQSFHGCAAYSKTTSLPGGTVIETEEGYLVLADSDDADLRFVPNRAHELEHVIRSGSERHFPPGISPFELQLDDFIGACQNGRPPMVDSVRGTASLQLIEDLYKHRRDTSQQHLAVGYGR